MEEEIEVLKYILTNIKIETDKFGKILKKKEIKDDVYNLIKIKILEYRKYIISISRMIDTRLKDKDKKKVKDETVFLNVIGSIGATIDNYKESKDYIKMLEETSKVNLMDISRIRQDYILKSKTINNLLNRIEAFENAMLEKINKISNK